MIMIITIITKTTITMIMIATIMITKQGRR